MKISVVTLLVLFGAPLLASGNAVHGDRTMTKVVKMLQDMLKKSQEDGETERDLYAKFKCYCDDNEANKKEEIKEITQIIQQLENEIDEVQADTGKLSTQAAEFKAGMAENEQFRKDAQSVRDKELEAFKSEETDMVDGLGAMDQAIDTLSEVGADQTASSGADHAKLMGKFLQKGSLLKLKSSVQEAMAAVRVLLSNKQKRTMESFLQAPFTGTYTAQSGEIVGILKNMRDTFKENLATIRAAEKQAAEAHAKIMKTKEEEFETMKTGYEEGQEKLGSNDDELADLREQLEEEEKNLADAEEFLAKLLKMCAEKAKEFEERNMMRANEEAAIAKAIAILNSDAAFEAFGKVKATKSGATGASFLQIQQHDHQSALRVNVIKLLEGAARKQKSVKIARIVLMLQAENPFDTVLTEIDKMIAIIDQEEKTDVENKEWCESERATNHEEKENTEREIEGLTDTINELDDAINNPETGLIKMIADTEESITKNHDNQAEQTASRAEENRAYQTNIKNIVGAEELLTKAIDVLKAYYKQFESEEEEKKELLQEEGDNEPNPNETWEGDYEGQSEQGGKVISMLEFIKKETHAEEMDAHKVENEAQHAFEDEMKDLKEEQKSLEETLAKYQLELAEKQKELAEKKEELKEAEAKLKAIEKYLLKIKPGCDYIAENYDTRKKNRNLEKDALKKAVDLIKGTPAYKKAVVAQEQEDLGDCKDICNEEGRDHAKCEACLAGTSVPGYCAGHKDTPGC